jgi:uncharacterized protein (DUF433 family)
MELSDRIEIDPDVMNGKPVIKDTRVTVELILKKLAEGAEVEDLLESYPHLVQDDVRAVFDYAAKTHANEEIIEPTGS